MALHKPGPTAVAALATCWGGGLGTISRLHQRPMTPSGLSQAIRIAFHPTAGELGGCQLWQRPDGTELGLTKGRLVLSILRKSPGHQGLGYRRRSRRYARYGHQRPSLPNNAATLSPFSLEYRRYRTSSWAASLWVFPRSHTATAGIKSGTRVGEQLMTRY